MKAVLICFSTKSRQFKSNYDRNRFFRGLYGWRQVINTGNKKYIYERQGLLGGIPHIRVDQSMFIIMERHAEAMREFLDGWEDKIDWQLFNVLLDDDQKKKLRGVLDG
ncbi:hypothetical protein A3K63_04960 [Candidatus Micrarchaeota archaeon RBG_16_49_10]|nr:MAG: hypothetical protein A3K63_04960 [Candidatus Micrarchaeota archaeon RBG_16_49_10]